MTDVLPPRLEGTVVVAPDRRLGFAEFGPPDGLPVLWFHGTPGARRQIPVEARALARSRESEGETLEAVWRSRFGTPPVDAAGKARQVRFLQGRGFALESVLEFLRHIPAGP